jgi:hypothetical protein
MAADTTTDIPGLNAPAPSRTAVPAGTRRLGLALMVISMAQLMLVLDEPIVNTALPQIQRAPHFSGTGLEWVVTGYAVTFGGLLMLGGRAGDILGWRRMLSGPGGADLLQRPDLPARCRSRRSERFTSPPARQLQRDAGQADTVAAGPFGTGQADQAGHAGLNVAFVRAAHACVQLLSAMGLGPRSWVSGATSGSVIQACWSR